MWQDYLVATGAGPSDTVFPRRGLRLLATAGEVDGLE
jgi:hypothetical protein